jgi:hypothetical protein
MASPSAGAARALTDEPLHVAPELLGQPLASPLRRGSALAIDLAIVIVPSLVVALAAALVALWWTRPAALQALVQMGADDRPAVVTTHENGELARLLVDLEAPGLPAEIAAASSAAS